MSMNPPHLVSEPDVICRLYSLAIIAEEKNKGYLPTYDEIMAPQTETNQMTSRDAANIVSRSTTPADSLVISATDRPYGDARSSSS